MFARLRHLHANPIAPGALTRSLSSTAVLDSQRERILRSIRKDWGPAYQKRVLPTGLLLDTLRDLQAERSLTNNSDKGAFAAWRKEAAFYRDARRAISQTAGMGTTIKPELTIGEIELVLSEDNGVSWSAIKQLSELGHIPKLSALSDEMKAAILFNRIYGIGDKIALSFAEAGFRTLEEVANENKIGNRKITDAMRLSLKYLEEMETMIPRLEIDQHKERIGKALSAADPGFKFEIMGSYRRGEAVSSDIDVVVWHESFQTRKDSADGMLEKVIKAFVDADVLDLNKFFSGLGGESGRRTAEPKKLIALTRLPSSTENPTPLHRQIDIRLCPVESLPYMLVGNTGDDRLMKILRGQAKAREMVLNEYGMGKRREDKTNTWPVDGTEVYVKNEREIFEILEVPYLEPHQRSYNIYSKILERRFF